MSSWSSTKRILNLLGYIAVLSSYEEGLLLLIVTARQNRQRKLVEATSQIPTNVEKSSQIRPRLSDLALVSREGSGILGPTLLVICGDDSLGPIPGLYCTDHMNQPSFFFTIVARFFDRALGIHQNGVARQW